MPTSDYGNFQVGPRPGPSAGFRAAAKKTAASIKKQGISTPAAKRATRVSDIVNRPAGHASQPGAAQNAASNARGMQGMTNLQNIMRQSGSTNVSDPYNWAGIAAALKAQQVASDPDPHNWAGIRAYLDSGGGGEGGGSSMPAPAPAPAVIQPPSTFQTPAQSQAPSAVTASAEGAVGAPSGMTFNSLGTGGTFGIFDRMRNQRSPKSGLSVTPEMLRAAAAARLGSA